MRNTVIKKSSRKKSWLIAGGVVLILAVLLVVGELTNMTYFFHQRKAVSSTIASASKTAHQGTSTKDDTKSSAPTAPSPAAEPAPSTGNSTSAPKEGDTMSNPTNAPLVAPYGDFVSNHGPGKNGSPAIETSVCSTTPGAQCYIAFTSAENPNVVKTLAAGTADSSGTVYWNNWDVRAAGFTNGIWHIKAVATLNGQTKTTPDTVDFEVRL